MLGGQGERESRKETDRQTDTDWLAPVLTHSGGVRWSSYTCPRTREVERTVCEEQNRNDRRRGPYSFFSLWSSLAPRTGCVFALRFIYFSFLTSFMIISFIHSFFFATSIY